MKVRLYKEYNYIIIDFDGTFDTIKRFIIKTFKQIDQLIIRGELFKNYNSDISFDKFAWRINSEDYISNHMSIFYVRIFIMTLLAVRSFTDFINVPSNTKKNIDKYKIKYLEYRRKDIDDMKKIISMVEEIYGYKVLIVTHNPFLKELQDELPLIHSNFKPYFIWTLKNKINISYVVGNNYMDDLFFQRKYGLRTVYVGQGTILKKICKRKNIKNFKYFDDFVEYLKRNK